MAKKISQLTQATQVKSDDVTVIVQDGETKKLPLNMMVTKQDIENKKVTGLAKLDEIEATYENDTYTPTITVKNKSSVKVGEGDGVDYSANVMDGHAKSAILKGQTLVNLFPNLLTGEFKKNTTTKDGDSLIFSKGSALELGVDKIKTSTTYTFILDIKENTLVGNGPLFQVVHNATSISLTGAELTNEVGLVKLKITTLNNLAGKNICLYVRDNATSGEIKIKSIMLLEGDYTNIDIPYFEGMQSVQMPVLTTTGKNLLSKESLRGYHQNVKEIDGWLIADEGDFGGNVVSKALIEKGKTYTLSTRIKTFDGGVAHYCFSHYGKNDFDYLGGNQPFNGVVKFTATETTYIDVWLLRNGVRGSVHYSDVQLEEGSAATSYEPYKSNILTVNEDVTLRGIGDVQDTLDLVTGEVTERIGEIVLDGSENWRLSTQSDDYADFRIMLDESLKSYTGSGGLCDKLKYQSNKYGSWIITDEGITVFNNQVILSVLKTRLQSADVSGFKTWLSQNPITVQYELAIESIKTVDLIPSGTHPSTTPYCWKNGHIQLSSSGLLPNLEYSVVTSRAGQINQNATMIVKNDKRIFDLEILLAGGLVNTTYQALTLQNQVETGLSKVSLNSETEPDYLLYHMIMKLIEEKAYKLDDLTEKVSVFYLYEKLSDEQFETIYSALYPFVEDEIVEEPVVEELPEVVEDEVIM